MKKFDLKTVVDKVKATDYKKLAKDFLVRQAPRRAPSRRPVLRQDRPV